MNLDLIDRLFEKRLQSDGHWIFVGSLVKGYGVMWYKGKLHYTHRLAAHLWLGLDLDSDNQSNHKKECTVKNCFNPDHLYIGNQSQNMRDEIGRHHQSDKIHCPQGHEYTPENTRYLRHLNGNPRRDCRKCHNESNRRYRESRKSL